MFTFRLRLDKFLQERCEGLFICFVVQTNTQGHFFGDHHLIQRLHLLELNVDTLGANQIKMTWLELGWAQETEQIRV